VQEIANLTLHGFIRRIPGFQAEWPPGQLKTVACQILPNKGGVPMNRIEELIEVLEKRHARTRAWIAKAQRRCIICQKPATTFRSMRAELEYSLSSICQSCQDYYIYDGTWETYRETDLSRTKEKGTEPLE